MASLGSEYDLGARAGQIRDDLMALQGTVKPADMLRIQLDDRAKFLARWQSLLLSLLDDKSVQDHPQRLELRRLLAGWNGRASVDSVAYRLVRTYHDRVQQTLWDAILGALAVAADEEVGPPAQFEGPLWQLLTTQPLHMLPRHYTSWPRVSARAGGCHASRSSRHELPASSRAAPGGRATSCASAIRCHARCLCLARLLDMPTLHCPEITTCRGCRMVRSAPRNASRSPRGTRSEGYLHCPVAQSGHPLSPYYRAGFARLGARARRCRCSRARASTRSP